MRTPKIVTAVALVASTLTAGLISSAAPAAAGPGDFEERWCGPAVSAPCLVSAERNGTLLTSADPDFAVEMTGKLVGDGDPYFMWLVNDRDLGDGTSLQTTDEWELVFNTGTMEPTYTEAYAGKPDVDAFLGGDGSHLLSYDAKPVVTTDGCNDAGAWPWPCSHTASDWRPELSGEVWNRASAGPSWEGFHRSQSAQGVNGVFLDTAPDGTRFLSSEMVNSHQYDEGGTLTTFLGEIRFRLPYKMLKDHFEVPDPKTLVASSLTGTINGDPTAGAWSVFHDPDGGGMIVDVSGITFSLKKIKLRRGVITPTRPLDVETVRTGARRGLVDSAPSSPRGAKVTGYVAKCTPVHGGSSVADFSESTDPVVIVTGLRAGKKYDCRMAALSNAGASRWSEPDRMAGQPG